MSRMIRKQIYIEPRQQAVLRRMAKEAGITESQVVRRALDQMKAKVERSREGRLAAWGKPPADDERADG